MNVYIKIQEVFSEVYVNYYRNKIETLDRKRIVFLIFAILSVLVFLISLYICLTPYIGNELVLKYNGGCYVFAFLFAFLSVIVADFSYKYLKNIDVIVKTDLMSRACGKLSKYIDLKWQKASLDKESFYKLFKKYNLVVLNRMFFKSDDSFVGKLGNINFRIFEISTKYTFFSLISKILICYGLPLLFSILSSILPGMLLGGAIYMLGQKLNIAFLTEIVVDNPQMGVYNIPIFSDLIGYTICVIFFMWIFTTQGDKSREDSFGLDMNLLDTFKGLFVEFDIPKDFKGHTVIFENEYENFMVKKFLTSKYEKVELEDVEFNKKFSVYSTNQIEVRYILTTSFMEKLKSLKQTFYSKYIRASFIDGKLVLAIQADKDLFRVASIFKKLSVKDYQTVFLELVSVLQIVDTLDLDVKTGL